MKCRVKKMADKHEHVFKVTKVDISNGQKFFTESCECGAKKQRSQSVKEKSDYHKSYDIDIK